LDNTKRLYLAHCGFYDPSIGEGVFENHTNFFITAETFDDAKHKAKQLPEFKEKRMHIDGLQEIQVVDGHRVALIPDQSVEGQTIIANNKYRQLAARTTT